LTIAFTGHRPGKLAGKHNEIIGAIQALLFKLKPDYAIVGMAEGADMLAAAICRMLKLPYEAAVPFEGQSAYYKAESLEAYIKLLEDADKVTLVSEGVYKPWYFQKRNEYMVDNCDLLIAIWDGSPGGTANCVKYAKKVGRKILYLNWETWEFEERE